jgi:hypothetical protein
MKRITVLALIALVSALGLSACSLGLDTSALQSGTWTLSKVAGVAWASYGLNYAFSGGTLTCTSTLDSSYSSSTTYTISGSQITIAASAVTTGLAALTYNVTISSSLMDWNDPSSGTELYEFTK